MMVPHQLKKQTNKNNNNFFVKVVTTLTKLSGSAHRVGQTVQSLFTVSGFAQA